MAGGAIELVVVLAVLWLLLIAWVAMVIVRGIIRGVGRLIGLGGRRSPSYSRLCTRLRCGADNPPQARFCRRCGSPLLQAAREGDRAAA